MIKTKISAGFCKVISADFVPSASYSLCMAKNEAESCVISIVSDESLSARIELTSPKTGFTVEIEREHTIEIDGVKYPDPLVPMSDGELTIEAGEIANILVRFTTTANTPAAGCCPASSLTVCTTRLSPRMCYGMHRRKSFCSWQKKAPASS